MALTIVWHGRAFHDICRLMARQSMAWCGSNASAARHPFGKALLSKMTLKLAQPTNSKMFFKIISKQIIMYIAKE